MSVTAIDLRREQEAHAKTREELAAAKERLAEMQGRPTRADLDAANAAAATAKAQLLGARKVKAGQKDVGPLEQRLKAARAELAGRPTAKDLEAAQKAAERAQAEAKRLRAIIDGLPTQRDVDDLCQRLERAQRNAKVEPREVVKTVQVRHRDDVAAIARLEAEVDALRRDVK